MGGQYHAQPALPSGEKSPWYPLDRVSRSRSRYGRYGENTVLQGIEPDSPAVQPLA
jgi:hypothetical protein